MKALFHLLLAGSFAAGLFLFAAAPGAKAVPAAAPPIAQPAATPTQEQRLTAIEAYLNNTDPALALRNANGGALPPGLAMSSLGIPGPGHNGWMLAATALVLFMTLPGLALSYGGLARRKNVLSVLAQCMGIAALVTVLWWAVGYSLVFSRGTPWLGSLKFALLKNVNGTPNPDYAPWVSHDLFAMFELMFAIITPALIIGAIAERMRFAAVLTFVGLWMFVVYFPVTHMVWGIDGAMNGAGNPAAWIKSIDFAGGTIVHMTSGWSGLILCVMLGRRIGYGKEKMPPHSMVLCMAGTCMMWVGWYGFNAGSALGADGVAANAFMVTTLSAAVGSGAWALAEWLSSGKSSVLGFCSGAFGGLVIAAPACGYIHANGAILLGVLGGLGPYFAVVKLKAALGFDDALDTFGVHAVGGTLGVLLTGFLARTDVNPRLSANLAGVVGHTLWLEQLKAICVVILISIVGTALIGGFVRVIMGLRVPPEEESLGLDLTEHGEEGYIL